MKPKTGRLAIFSLCLNLAFILFFAGKRIYYSHSAPPPLNTNEAALNTRHWADVLNAARTTVFNDVPITKNDIVFVGNSLTESFPLQEMFPGKPVKNRGIAGNRTDHILVRMRSILEGQPRKIFLEMGVNDIDQGIADDTAFSNYLQTVKEIRTYSPKTILYVISIFPTTGRYSRCQQHIPVLNERIKYICDSLSLHYVDVYSSLVKGNELDSALTFDGIHLNGKGYEIWKKAIDSLVN